MVRLSLRAVSHSRCCAFYVINSKYVTSPRSFTKPRTGRTRTGQKPAYILVFRVAFDGKTTAYRRKYYFLPLSRRNTNVFRPSLSSLIIWIHSLVNLSPFFQASLEFNAEPLEWKDLSYRLWWLFWGMPLFKFRLCDDVVCFTISSFQLFSCFNVLM